MFYAAKISHPLSTAVQLPEYSINPDTYSHIIHKLGLVKASDLYYNISVSKTEQD